MALPKTRSRGPPAEELRAMLPTMHDLKGDGLTILEVQEVMIWLYSFGAPYEPRLSTFQTKCKGIKSRVDRHRMRKRPLISKEFATLLIESESFRVRPSVDRPIPFKRYRTQEQIVYHVDWFLHHLLDRRVAEFWTMETSRFVKKQDKTLRIVTDEESHWQLLADRCFGASTLVQARESSQADVTLKLLFDDIGKKAKLEDPYLMFKIWRMSQRLRGIEARHPRRQPIVKDFFLALRKAASQLGTKDHPITHLIELLGKVKDEDFRETLRLGSYKTITTLTRNLGNNNPVILHMWTDHYLFWDKGRCDPQLVSRLEKLCTDTVRSAGHPEYLWCLPVPPQFEYGEDPKTKAAMKLKLKEFQDFLEHRQTPKIPEACVPICFYYTYAYQQFGKEPALATYLAMNLRDTTRKLVEPGTGARWNLTTQAYAFAAKIVAGVCRRQQDLEQDTESREMARAMAHEHLDEAIRRLEFGDRECQTRAAMLSDINGRWLQKWNPTGANEERERHKRIVKRIQGLLQEASTPSSV